LPAASTKVIPLATALLIAVSSVQNRLTGCRLCGSYNIFFVSGAIAVVVAAIP
jgi:hypothetical protein